MTLKKYIRLSFIIVSVLLLGQKSLAQCFQIESILVDACGPSEGLNEMVRFKIGPVSQNVSNLTVVWPNNPWQGVIQNATTASNTATLNGDILDAGGCGQLIEPTGGVLPANANVILVTSFNLDTALNSFGALTQNIYIIYQNNPATASGHFANSGTGLRTLTISFGACTDTVTYDRALLVDTIGNTTAADGAIVVYTPNNVATYINNGCSAPVDPFTVNAGPASVNACAGATISLSGSAEGQTSVSWSAASGSFSAQNSLSSSYTLSPTATGTIPLTLTATNSCGLTITDVISVNVVNSQAPNFTTPLTICTGSTAPILNATSPNGITGTWSPATVSNTTSGNYVFTPNAGQCAVNFTLHVDVTNSITPNFTTPLTICTGSTAPLLNATSPNGITGTWSPATVNNTTTGNYIFTPNAGQCASNFTLHVDVTNSITPNFTTPLTICNGSTAPLLNATSPNGITGIWSPATVSNTTSGNYIFTPNAGQCASNFTLHVDVTNSITPDFTTPLTICTGSTAPILNATSPNGITGTWSPATVSNTTSGNYVFMPNAGQCASNFTLHVDVTNNITPNFTTPLTICTGSTAPILNATSPNGITGTWSPATVNNTTSGNYVFTPNAGQCAVNFTLHVEVSSIDFGIDDDCVNGNYILQAIALVDGFNVNDIFEWRNVQGQLVSTDSILNVTELLATVTNPQFPMTFELTVRNNEGCSKTVSKIVYGTLCQIQRGITPNGDELNDVFDLSGLSVAELTIFNRYGTEVYNLKNYVKQWSGSSSKGDDLPDGTYFYVIRKSNDEKVTGWIYILREN